MPRIPPTKYDPLRLVQPRLAAAPPAPAIAIPPTRFDPGVRHRATMIQRAAAAASPAAAAAASAGGVAANSDDTPAVKFARGLTPEQRAHHLAQDAVIGGDQPDKPEVLKHIQTNWADCLAVWLVDKHNGTYSKDRNIDWLKACSGSKKVKILNLSVINDVKMGIIKATDPNVIKANKRKYLTTADEAAILLFRGYVLAGDCLGAAGAAAGAAKK